MGNGRSNDRVTSMANGGNWPASTRSPANGYQTSVCSAISSASSTSGQPPLVPWHTTSAGRSSVSMTISSSKKRDRLRTLRSSRSSTHISRSLCCRAKGRFRGHNGHSQTSYMRTYEPSMHLRADCAAVLFLPTLSAHLRRRGPRLRWRGWRYQRSHPIPRYSTFARRVEWHAAPDFFLLGSVRLAHEDANPFDV